MNVYVDPGQIRGIPDSKHWSFSATFMIISRLNEGLGNQLFQYAMGRATAVRHDTRLKLDLRWFSGDQGAGREVPRRRYQLDAFHIEAEPASARELAVYAPRRQGVGRFIDKLLRNGSRRIAPQVIEPHLRFWPQGMERSDAHLCGFWQNEKYFADCGNVIRREFRLRDSPGVTRVREQSRRWRADGASLCSIHVRRGDLLSLQEGGPVERQHGPPTSIAYLHRAMNMFPPTCRFVVVTEPRERPWCRQNILHPRAVHYDGENELADFAMLHSCDHNIIANSTFSWWAAWLNENPGKRVIAPAQWGWPVDDNDYMFNDELIPAAWTTLSDCTE